MLNKRTALLSIVLFFYCNSMCFAENILKSETKENIVNIELTDELTDEELEEERKKEEELLKYKQDLTYIEQMKVIDSHINNLDNELNSIIESLNKIQTDIEEKNIRLVDIQKEIMSIRQNRNNENYSDLNLFEMVLNSNSFSELFKNLDLAKKITTLINKEIKILKLEELQILNEKEKLIEEEEIFLSKRSDLEKDLDVFYKEKEALVKLMGRKSDSLGFNPMNVLEKSNISVDDMYLALDNTMLYDLAPVFIECENKYGINAIFLASLAAHESNWGKSRRAIEDNNLTGFGVYSDDAVGINAPTKRDNLLQTASWLKEKYLTPGAVYYNGLSIQAINIRYCIGKNNLSDFSWSDSIQRIGTIMFEKIKKNDE